MSAFTLAELKRGLLDIHRIGSPPEASRASEYQRYCKLARQRGIEPGTFREYCEVMDGYDREWEVANYEYDHKETP